jgi:hypothetical protein
MVQTPRTHWAQGKHRGPVVLLHGSPTAAAATHLPAPGSLVVTHKPARLQKRKSKLLQGSPVPASCQSWQMPLSQKRPSRSLHGLVAQDSPALADGSHLSTMHDNGYWHPNEFVHLVPTPPGSAQTPLKHWRFFSHWLPEVHGAPATRSGPPHVPHSVPAGISQLVD